MLENRLSLTVPQDASLEEVVLARKLSRREERSIPPEAHVNALGSPGPGASAKRRMRSRRPPSADDSTSFRQFPPLSLTSRPVTTIGGVRQGALVGVRGGSMVNNSMGPTPDPATLLASKCNQMATRLAQVEGELLTLKASAAAANSEAVKKQLKAASPAQGNGVDSGPQGEAENRRVELERTVDGAFSQISSMVDNLSDVFSNAQHILATRRTAATRISSLVRRYVARCRFLRMQDVLKAWRVQHSVTILQCIRGEIVRQKQLEAIYTQLRTRVDHNMVRKVFREWVFVVGENEERKYQIKELTARVAKRQIFQLQERVFREWWDVMLGPRSGRMLAKKNRDRMQVARETLHAQLVAQGREGQIVTSEMVRAAMNRGAVQIMEASRKTRRLVVAFWILADEVELRKQQARDSIRLCRRNILGKCIRGWQRWAALNSGGLARKPMTAYKVTVGLRYNPKRVQQFADQRCKSSHFTAWAQKAAQLAKAGRKGQGVLTRVAKQYFDVWQEETVRQRRMRRAAMGVWQANSTKSLTIPFRMWYIFVDRQKRQTEDQERIVNVYRRARSRHFCYKILRAWRHQACYGRVEGLYTRPQLMASLAEQKEHCFALNQEVNDLSGTVEDMNKVSTQYRTQMISRQKEVADLRATIDKLNMAMHHAEQDVVRMQTVVEAVVKIAPHVHDAVMGMAPSFNFHDRGLTPLAATRQEDVEREEEEKFQTRLHEWLEEHHYNDRPGQEGEGADAGTALSDGGSIASSGGGGGGRRVGPAVVMRDASTETSGSNVKADSTEAAQAALAAAALTDGVEPILLPGELEVLDRVGWVMEKSNLEAVLERTRERMSAFDRAREEAFEAERRQAREELEAAERATKNARLLVDRYQTTFGTLEDDGADPFLEQQAMAVKSNASASGGGEQLGGNGNSSSSSISSSGGSTGPGGGGAAAAAAPPPSEEPAEQSRLLLRQCEQELAYVAGLHEFLRKGDLEVLTPAAAEEWGKRPSAGLAVLRKGMMSSLPWLSLGNNASGCGAGVDGKMTWHDFCLALTSRTPQGRVTETVRDRLQHRLGEAKEHVDSIIVKALCGNDPPARGPNLYSSSSGAAGRGDGEEEDEGVKGGEGGDAAPGGGGGCHSGAVAQQEDEGSKKWGWR